MATKELPSPEFLRKLLRYEPETGRLFWRPRPAEMFADDAHCRTWNTRYAHQEAFTAVLQGKYFTGRIFGVNHRAHRVIWALSTGAWPDGTVDHIDGDTRNNRLTNLRDVPQAENSRNAKLPKNNSSGHVGVRWFSARGKWVARIKHDRREIHLGYFERLEDAVEARREASARFGFHVNHGCR